MSEPKELHFRRSFALALAAVIVVGATSTAFLLSGVSPDLLEGRVLPLVAGLAITIVFTTANVGLRWIRWHFLTRRLQLDLLTRDSLLIYAVTLPTILTPFYLGELLRPVLLRRKCPGHATDLATIWLVERTTDLLVLAIFVALAGRSATLALVAGALWCAVVVGVRRSRTFRYRGLRLRVFTLGAVVVSTAVSWVLPGISLWVIMGLLDERLPLKNALAVFSHGTIIGGLSGLPLGTVVTGSRMVLDLQGLDVGRDAAVVGVALLRTGTAWFAVALGLAAIMIFRSRLVSIIRGLAPANHFDAIADEYATEIPGAVQSRLLTRKSVLIRDSLDAMKFPRSARGLDIGCGHGWYACELAGQGYEIHALDQSRSQIENARTNAKRAGLDVRFEVVDAAVLPYPDNYFDFSYAINVLHHVINDDDRRMMLSEIVRTLRPGGVLFLHEINTNNPLFRFYMGYVFPFLRTIDEGFEKWLRPDQLPDVPAAEWLFKVSYFTFLPDFTPSLLLRLLAPLEAALEASRFRSWSAHFMARLVKLERGH